MLEDCEIETKPPCVQECTPTSTTSQVQATILIIDLILKCVAKLHEDRKVIKHRPELRYCTKSPRPRRAWHAASTSVWPLVCVGIRPCGFRSSKTVLDFMHRSSFEEGQTPWQFSLQEGFHLQQHSRIRRLPLECCGAEIHLF